MTIIHYSASAFLSAAALNPSCWQSHSCPAPVHTCPWAGNSSTSQQWLVRRQLVKWQFPPACGLLVLLLSLPLLAPHCTGTSNCCKRVFNTSAKCQVQTIPSIWLLDGVRKHPRVTLWPISVGMSLGRSLGWYRDQIWLSCVCEGGIKPQRYGLESLRKQRVWLAGYLASYRFGGTVQAQIKLCS